MNSLSPEELRVHDVLRETFGEDEDLVVAVVTPNLASEAGLRALDELTGRIESIPGIRRVYSLTNAIELVPGRDGAIEQPLLPSFGSDDFERRVAQAIARNPELSGFLVGSDTNTAGLLVELEHRPGDDSYRRVVIDSLRALADDPPGQSVSVFATGVAAQKYEVARLLERDQSILIPASVGVLGLVLLLFFKSLAGVVLPLGVTGVSVRVAIDRTTTETGRALAISSVVLAVGFWVGALGSFKPTVYFSLFTGLTMLSALACDLLVLPAILVLGSRAWRSRPAAGITARFDSCAGAKQPWSRPCS